MTEQQALGRVQLVEVGKPHTAGVVSHSVDVRVGQKSLYHVCVLAQIQASRLRRTHAHGYSDIDGGESTAPMDTLALPKVRARSFRSQLLKRALMNAGPIGRIWGANACADDAVLCIEDEQRRSECTPSAPRERMRNLDSQPIPWYANEAHPIQVDRKVRFSRPSFRGI